MNIHLPLFGVSLLALSATGIAQVGNAPKPPPASAPAIAVAQSEVRLHSLNDLIGLEIKSQDNKVVGKVDDVVLDSADGSVDYVVIGQGGVLGVGGDKYLVPFESILFAPPALSKDESLHPATTLTEERIKKAPKYAKDQHIGPEIERAIREAAGLTPSSTQPRAENSELVCAKRMLGAELLGSTLEKIGEFDDVIVDPCAGVVAYNVVAVSGEAGLSTKHYALPWEVTHLRVNPDSKVVCRSDLTKELLAKAPEYDSKDPKRMASSTYVREVCAHYTVEPYFARAAPASAPRVPAPPEKRKDGK